jgi:hypothetical protein
MPCLTWAVNMVRYLVGPDIRECVVYETEGPLTRMSTCQAGEFLLAEKLWAICKTCAVLTVMG